MPTAYSSRRVRRTAWDANSEALAQLREPEAFTAINESYQALEGTTYIAEAADEETVPSELLPLLEQAISRLIKGCRGVRAAGRAQRGIDPERGAGPRAQAGPVALWTLPRRCARRPLGVATISIYLQDRARDVAGHAIAVAAGTALHRPGPARIRHAWPDREVRGRPRRLILDARNGTDLAATVVVRREGDPDCGRCCRRADDALGVTYDFFFGVLGLDSYDGEGA